MGGWDRWLGKRRGSFEDENFVSHTFVRSVDGTVTRFDVPGSFGTCPLAISGATITGFYGAPSGSFQAFLRAPNGAFTIFKAPRGDSNVYIPGINLVGAVTGDYYAVNGPYTGLVARSERRDHFICSAGGRRDVSQKH